MILFYLALLPSTARRYDEVSKRLPSPEKEGTSSTTEFCFAAAKSALLRSLNKTQKGSSMDNKAEK